MKVCKDNAVICKLIAFFLVGMITVSVFSPAQAQDLNSSVSQVRIMPLGDSITRGSDYNGYREPLYSLLTGEGYNFDFVGSLAHGDFEDRDHEGHFNWRADEILAQINSWAGTYEPDIVLIHLGTVDVDQGNNVQSTIDELGQIIDELRYLIPNVTVLLAQIIPCPRCLNSQLVEELNTQIPSLENSRRIKSF